MNTPVLAATALLLTVGCAWVKPPADSTTGLGTVAPGLDSYLVKEKENDSPSLFPWNSEGRYSSDQNTAGQKEMERKAMRDLQQSTDRKADQIMERRFR